MTINVLGAANPDRERRRVLIADVLQRLEADVVALQEARVDVVEDLLGAGWSVVRVE